MLTCKFCKNRATMGYAHDCNGIFISNNIWNIVKPGKKVLDTRLIDRCINLRSQIILVTIPRPKKWNSYELDMGYDN